VAAADAYAAAPTPNAAPAPVVASATATIPAASEPVYTLDTGDKLRVGVFGQDGISNSFIVDAGGKVNLPLIGTVTARSLTNQQLA
jgi:polysaccharide export outer membrane protein